MSREIVFILGSPSPASRSSLVARAIADHAEREGFATRAFSVRDFDPSDVLLARVDAPGVKAFVAAARGAAAIVLASPVYKAAYAGGLKAIVDLIPHDALPDRPALGIATTRAPAHGRHVEQAYRALFAFFGAQTLDPLVVLDEELAGGEDARVFSDAARARVEASGRALVHAVRAGERRGP